MRRFVSFLEKELYVDIDSMYFLGHLFLSFNFNWNFQGNFLEKFLMYILTKLFVSFRPSILNMQIDIL